MKPFSYSAIHPIVGQLLGSYSPRPMRCAEDGKMSSTSLLIYRPVVDRQTCKYMTPPLDEVHRGRPRFSRCSQKGTYRGWGSQKDLPAGMTTDHSPNNIIIVTLPEPSLCTDKHCLIYPFIRTPPLTSYHCFFTNEKTAV